MMRNTPITTVRVVGAPDFVDVAPEDGVHPDAGVLAQNHVTNDLCRIVHVTGLRNHWRFPFIRTNHDWNESRSK